MNVNSIKINNVMFDGEVDLDNELPTAIEGLEVVEGLVESVTEHEAEIGGLIENENILGAKNLTNIDDFTTYNTTRNGLSFTNSVTDSKPLNLNAYYYNNSSYISAETLENSVGVHNITITVPANTTKIYIRHSGTDNDLQIGIPWTKTGTYKLCYNLVTVDTSTVGGFEISNIMLMLPAETDTTYAPYSKSNKQLTSDATMLLENKELLGAKNIIPLSLSILKGNNTSGTWVDNEYSYRGVTFTVNSDSLGNVTDITVNGTASDITRLSMPIDITDRVILSGCHSGGSLQTYELQYYVDDVTYRDFGDGVEFTGLGADGIIAITIRSGYLANNLKFYPMLRLASDTDKTYRPYSMSTTELTQKIIDLEARVTALEG